MAYEDIRAGGGLLFLFDDGIVSPRSAPKRREDDRAPFLAITFAFFFGDQSLEAPAEALRGGIVFFVFPQILRLFFAANPFSLMDARVGFNLTRRLRNRKARLPL